MSRRSLTRLAVLCLAVSVIGAPAEARKKKAASTEPGKYTSWGPDIDEIEIVKPFQAAGYKSIVVVPFDTSEVKLPEKDDNTYEPVQQVLANPAAPFAKGLEKSGMKVSVSDQPGKDSETLIIRGKVETMDPGSRAARYFAGFGAGAARAKVTAEVVDAKSGEVLVRFTQERRSGVGAAGGGYVDLMNRNLTAIGTDVANIVGSF
ncbi:MAG TPA: DUF4410 domain-containing protein [Thermoanaerobaculia bacterium]|nr:DUF4410 domain-containing protein [Thermoanaerobaculia bacterium]